MHTAPSIDGSVTSVPVTFTEMPYTRPDEKALIATAEALIGGWDAAANENDAIALVRKWNANAVESRTLSSLAGVRFEGNTADTAAKAEKEFFDRLEPTMAGLGKRFHAKALASKFRPGLEREFGPHLLKLWELSLSTFDDRIADDRRREAELKNQYTELLAKLSVNFRGETMTLTQLAGFYGDADRATRQESNRLRFAAFGEHTDSLDSLYDGLVKIRDGAAKKLGFKRYTELGYALMRRTEYGPEQVAAFRKQVRDVIVPIATAIGKRQAERLGIPKVMFHDEQVRDTRGVPKPKGDLSWVLDRTGEIFKEMGSDFDAFYGVMRGAGLLDLDSRPGKSGGGFCTSFPKYKVPFIFANFNGTQDDVRVLTHEAGHAFQSWRSQQHELLEHRMPTYEACEIHSMGLEHLTHPWMESYFGDDATPYREGHLEHGITFLPYACAVDEFQHRVYDEPDASPARRAEFWKECEATYLPGRAFDGMPYPESGRFWQVQRHIYLFPFYYIDYALALTCAMQLWHQAIGDRETTMANYRKLCALGGTLPFLSLLKECGLKSPFEAGVLDGVAMSVREAVGL
jgi:M3 family oligoendopeptidase